MAPKGDPMMSKALCDAQMKPIIMALYGDGNGNPGLIKRTNLIWDGVREAAGVEKERLRSQTEHEKAVKDALDLAQTEQAKRDKDQAKAQDDRDRERDKKDRRFKRYISIATVAIMIFMAFMTWRDSQRKVSAVPPSTQTFQTRQPPQDAINREASPRN